MSESEKPKSKPFQSPEMDKAVQNMFRLSRDESQRIIKSKPGNRRPRGKK